MPLTVHVALCWTFLEIPSFDNWLSGCSSGKVSQINIKCALIRWMTLSVTLFWIVITEVCEKSDIMFYIHDIVHAFSLQAG